MRVITGKYRGKKIVAPEGFTTRPTLQRVREAIFSSIQFSIVNAKVLDLFAGTGLYGIECLSRGAKSVHFVDNNRQAINVLEKNLISINDDYTISHSDSINFLSDCNDCFDLVFLDPPYGYGNINKIFDLLSYKNLIHNNTIIIYERDKESSEIQNNIEGFQTFKTSTYGKTSIEYIKKHDLNFDNEICALTGSFDPFTIAHEKIVEEALTKFKKVHIIMLDNEAKNYYFSKENRLKMIEEIYRNNERVGYSYSSDYAFTYLNSLNIKYIIRGIRSENDYIYEQEMSEYNLKKGNINTIILRLDKDFKNVSSTKVRECIQSGDKISKLVSKPVEKIIMDILKINKQ